MSDGLKVFELTGHEVDAVRRFNPADFRQDFVLPPVVQRTGELSDQHTIRVAAILGASGILGAASFAPRVDAEKYEVASLFIRSGAHQLELDSAAVASALLYHGGLLVSQRSGLQMGAYALANESKLFGSAGFIHKKAVMPERRREKVYWRMEKELGLQHRQDLLWRGVSR